MTVRAVVGLWRWRANPLCRDTDRREAWLALCTAVLVVLGAPLVGLLAGSQAHQSLVRTSGEQQRARHQVWAQAERSEGHGPPRGVPQVHPEGAQSAANGARSQIPARWDGPDGTARQGSVPAPSAANPGDRFRIWVDAQGRVTSPPLSRDAAPAHAALAGFGAAAASAAAVESGRRLAMWGVLRRRYSRWDEEWERIGPDWGRTGTGS